MYKTEELNGINNDRTLGVFSGEVIESSLADFKAGDRVKIIFRYPMWSSEIYRNEQLIHFVKHFTIYCDAETPYVEITVFRPTKDSGSLRVR